MSETPWRPLAAALWLAACPAPARAQPPVAAIRYVDAGATGANDGTSWTDAFVELAQALGQAAPGDQVWIARGTYRPDFDPLTGTHTGDRDASFLLPPGVVVAGGFAGGETSLAQRDFAANPTVLSGDVGVPGDPSDDSYHVVNGFAADAGSRLDGLILERGNADGLPGSGRDLGGAVFSSGGELLLVDCTLRDNYAFQGGAIWSRFGSLGLLRCTFLRNSAEVEGGAFVQRQGATTDVVNCWFETHTAGRAGVALIEEGPATFVNCVIWKTRTAGGSALRFWESTSKVRNCTFHFNASGAPSMPAALGSWKNSLVNVRNTIFSQNGNWISGAFVGLHAGSGSGSTWNCQWCLFDPGAGQVGPLFVDSDAGDFRLLPGAKAIDFGAVGVLPADVLDADGDGDTLEKIPVDLGGDPRRVDDPATPDGGQGAPPIVDIGAYEFQP